MTPLHLIQIELDGDALRRWAATTGLGMADLGYTVHALTRAAYGDLGPQPFRVTPRGRTRDFKLLGYAPAPVGDLIAAAALGAEPQVAACLRQVDGRPMPEDWRLGLVLDFETRVCPIRRLTGDTGRAEIDAKVAEVRRAEREGRAPLTPEATYVAWLAERLEPRGAALQAAEVIQRTGLMSRRKGGGGAGEGGRMTRTHEKPDVTLRGRLSITDSAAFADLLRRGVGRHKAFGFGMLLLRPPGPGFLTGD
jgi:CRISPR system Cascade subunit CasE